MADYNCDYSLIATRLAQEQRDRTAIEALLATCVPPDRRPLAMRCYAKLRQLFQRRPSPTEEPRND